eukprot:1163211-Prymnesium_polylepis.1
MHTIPQPSRMPSPALPPLHRLTRERQRSHQAQSRSQGGRECGGCGPSGLMGARYVAIRGRYYTHATEYHTHSTARGPAVSVARPRR